MSLWSVRGCSVHARAYLGLEDVEGALGDFVEAVHLAQAAEHVEHNHVVVFGQLCHFATG